MMIEMHSDFGWAPVYIAAHEDKQVKEEVEVAEAKRLHRVFQRPYRIVNDKREVSFEIGTEELEERY